ncbi:MAG: SH3 domain-containing protein [Nitrospinaceae bacterium]|nr:SH3 domain-containing protein [Nitrospinaceae bacterium]
MKTSKFGVKTLITLILLVIACATAPSQFFESAPGRIPMSDQELFSRAMAHQKKGQIEPAIGLWEKFLQKYPQSFEARNNLGLLHYANDEITLAITQFEQGRNLEIGSVRIKENLTRALKVRVAILEENKEYDSAVVDLNRIAQLSPIEEQEKIERQIEGFEDKIFEQVKKSNLLEEYQGFLEKHPNSPRNSDEARLLIEELQQIEEIKKEDQFSVIPESDLETKPPAMSEEMVEESFAPDEMPDVPQSLPEETIEIVKESVAPESAPESAPAPPVEVSPPAEPEVVAKPVPMVNPAPVVPPEPAPQPTAKVEPKAEPAPPPAPKMVEVIKARVLRVRAEPKIEAGNIVYKLKKGAKTVYTGENEGWYQVEYTKGKKGWISKQYSKLLE